MPYMIAVSLEMSDEPNKFHSEIIYQQINLYNFIL